MSILEHYIQEVHDIKPVEGQPDLIEIDVTCECWGSVERKTITRTRQGWEHDKKNGYFMA